MKEKDLKTLEKEAENAVMDSMLPFICISLQRQEGYYDFIEKEADSSENEGRTLNEVFYAERVRNLLRLKQINPYRNVANSEEKEEK